MHNRMAKSFLTKVLQNFSSLIGKNFNEPIKILLAVSGGADSMAMLSAFLDLREKINAEIFVLTVNHNIRSEKESAGDAAFVLDFCKNKCPCILAEIPKNKILEEARIRKTGIEDTARFLRYKEFEKAADNFNVGYILTAHNKNDYYETVLMRLFQGSDPESLMGISFKRGRFIRPLLNISRYEIEEYLKEKKILWREDSSNMETSYLRNKIRHNLIPALNLCFDGWQSGLEKTLNKIKAQNNFLADSYKAKKKIGFWTLQKNEKYGLFCCCDFLFFIRLEDILKYKFLQEGLIMLKGKRRIPHSVFDDLMHVSNEKTIVFSGGFCAKKENDVLFLFKQDQEERSEEIGYSVWIDRPGKFDTPSGSFTSIKEAQGFYLIHESDKTGGIGPFKTPFCIRSRLAGDEIEMVSGSKKSLKKIINEWDIDYEKRNLLPIIEEGGLVKGIYGAAIGSKNWYVVGS